MASIVMNVPVRPTPALEERRKGRREEGNERKRAGGEERGKNEERRGTGEMEGSRAGEERSKEQ